MLPAGSMLETTEIIASVGVACVEFEVKRVRVMAINLREAIGILGEVGDSPCVAPVAVRGQSSGWCAVSPRYGLGPVYPDSTGPGTQKTFDDLTESEDNCAD